MSFNIRTDSIVNRLDDGQVSLPYGASLPSGSKLTVQGNVNLTGVTTVGFLTASNANVTGVVTATSFVGDGSAISNIPSVSLSKSIALKLIISDPPLRS